MATLYDFGFCRSSTELAGGARAYGPRTPITVRPVRMVQDEPKQPTSWKVLVRKGVPVSEEDR